MRPEYWILLYYGVGIILMLPGLRSSGLDEKLKNVAPISRFGVRVSLFWTAVTLWPLSILSGILTMVDSRFNPERRNDDSELSTATFPIDERRHVHLARNSVVELATTLTIYAIVLGSVGLLFWRGGQSAAMGLLVFVGVLLMSLIARNWWVTRRGLMAEDDALVWTADKLGFARTYRLPIRWIKEARLIEVDPIAETHRLELYWSPDHLRGDLPEPTLPNRGSRSEFLPRKSPVILSDNTWDCDLKAVLSWLGQQGVPTSETPVWR